MKRNTIRRFKMLALLGLPLIAIAVVVLVLSFSPNSTTQVSADAGHTTDIFSMGIDTAAGGDNDPSNDVCTTKTGGPTKCTMSLGVQFALNVYLQDVVPTVFANYLNMDVTVKVDETAFNGKAPSIKWPAHNMDPNGDGDKGDAVAGCGFGTPYYDTSLTPDETGFGCTVGLDNSDNPFPSTYEGRVFSVRLACKGTGNLTLVHGIAVPGVSQVGGHAEVEDSTEVLSVNCATPTSTPVPTDTPTPTNTPTQTPTATPPPVPRWVKADVWSAAKVKDFANSSSTNLFLTRQGDKIPPLRCEASTDAAAFVELLTIPIVSPDPKGALPFQKLGAFEFEVRFDPKLVCVNLIDIATGGSTRYPILPAVGGWMCIVDDKDEGQLLDGIARIGCVSKGKTVPNVPNFQTLGPILAVIQVQPQPELYSQIRPNQDNGIAVQLLDQDCKLSDDQGHPIAIFSCEDADVTVRYLEGDVEPDCQVDALDQQNVAFRWGAGIGNIRLYNERFDLEPSGTVKGDGDIDIRDLQFVFGRHGSKCTQWNNRGLKGPIWPDQPPVNPKD